MATLIPTSAPVERSPDEEDGADDAEGDGDGWDANILSCRNTGKPRMHYPEVPFWLIYDLPPFIRF